MIDANGIVNVGEGSRDLEEQKDHYLELSGLSQSEMHQMVKEANHRDPIGKKREEIEARRSRQRGL